VRFEPGFRGRFIAVSLSQAHVSRDQLAARRVCDDWRRRCISQELRSEAWPRAVLSGCFRAPAYRPDERAGHSNGGHEIGAALLTAFPVGREGWARRRRPARIALASISIGSSVVECRRELGREYRGEAAIAPWARRARARCRHGTPPLAQAAGGRLIRASLKSRAPAQPTLVALGCRVGRQTSPRSAGCWGAPCDQAMAPSASKFPCEIARLEAVELSCRRAAKPPDSERSAESREVLEMG